MPIVMTRLDEQIMHLKSYLLHVNSLLTNGLCVVILFKPASRYDKVFVLGPCSIIINLKTANIDH